MSGERDIKLRERLKNKMYMSLPGFRITFLSLQIGRVQFSFNWTRPICRDRKVH